MSVTAYTDIPRSEDFLGHPKGVFVCFFTEMWERFSFYGMKALLLLYLLKHHGFGDDAGYDLIGAYGGLVYAVPVLGGPVIRLSCSRRTMSPMWALSSASAASP